MIFFRPVARTLVAQEHTTFRRKGADLVIEKSLTLSESLCGFDFCITHMDKRSLRVKSNPGQVTKHDDVFTLDGEGMPTVGNPFVKGRLFIVFKVCVCACMFVSCFDHN